MISLYIVCLILVVIGALNWGLVGAANFNLVSSVTSLVSSNPSTVNTANRVIYVAVGLALNFFYFFLIFFLIKLLYAK